MKKIVQVYLGLYSVFIWNTVGDGLNKYIEKSDNKFIKVDTFPEIYVISMFVVLILLSLIIKKIFNVEINKNSLGDDLSPYLQQHKIIINWQKWTKKF